MSKKSNTELRIRAFVAFGRKVTVDFTLSWPYWLAGDDAGSTIFSRKVTIEASTRDLYGTLFDTLRLMVAASYDCWSEIKESQELQGGIYSLPDGFHSLRASLNCAEALYEELDFAVQNAGWADPISLKRSIDEAESAGLLNALQSLTILTDRSAKQCN